MIVVCKKTLGEEMPNYKVGGWVATSLAEPKETNISQ